MRLVSKMKFMTLNFTLVFLFNSSFAQESPPHYKSDIDFGAGTVISTFLDLRVVNGQFKITSPKNADRRVLGAKAKLGRLLGKLPKKGIFVTIKGVQKNDSLFGDAAVPVFGRLKFRGIAKNETLSGELLNKEGVFVGKLEGVYSKEDRIDFKNLHPNIIKTVEENIYSKQALQTGEWKTFENKMEKLCNVAHDDIEVYIGFSILAHKLPFTHLYLLIGQDSITTDEPANKPKSVVFEEKNDSTAYLQIKNFVSSDEELAATLPRIVNNPAYKNLIIDLRDNGGGGVGPAFELAKYIATEDMEIGYFPTNKLSYSEYQPEVFKTLAERQPRTTDELGQELLKSPGVKLIFKKPTNPVFAGKIYILTNGNTGSTCEPIVYTLKKNKKATIIGEKTAGAMLAALPFVVSGKYMLLLPVADFYTHDGIRLDKVGVEPDIKVKSEDALKKALDVISGVDIRN